MRKHYVTFLSPGTFFMEQSTRPLTDWNMVEAVTLAATITERHNAKPYGFYFTTQLTGEPVPDGEGGQLEVQEKEIARSGTYYLGGELLTVDQIAARVASGAIDLRILLSNMEANDWPVVIENRNSWRVTLPFTQEDVLVDILGNILDRGDNLSWRDYRARKIAEYKERVAQEMAKRNQQRAEVV